MATTLHIPPTTQTAHSLVDADLHLAETPADLAPYCDLPWRRVLEDSAVNPPWSVTGTTLPTFHPSDAAPPARTPAAMLAHLDATGATHGVLLPGALLRLGALPTVAYAAALARAYNRWLVEAWVADGKRLRGAIVATPQDPADAAAEIARYASHGGIVAVLLPVAGVDPLWGDRRYDPIYAAAAAANLPVILHGGADVLLPGSPNLVTQFATPFEQLAVSHPLIAGANLVSMVGTGVFPRFPSLRVVFAEAGVSWFAHFLLRMDKEYNENRRDIPFYTDRVSAYLRRQVWLGTHPMERGTADATLDDLLRLSCGIGQVVYGSHWPLADHDTAQGVEDALSEDDTRAMILGTNARALFALPDGTEG